MEKLTKRQKRQRIYERNRLEVKKREACLDALLGKSDPMDKVVVAIDLDVDTYLRSFDGIIQRMDVSRHQVDMMVRMLKQTW